MFAWLEKILRDRFPSLYYRKVPDNHPCLQPPPGFDASKGVIIDAKAQAELGELLKNAPVQGVVRRD